MKLQKSKLLACCLLILLLGSLVTARAVQTRRLTAAQAKDHIGETATVCGVVVDTSYAEKSKGHPTFLNFEQKFPRQTFTAVIWEDNRPKFGRPEIGYKGKRICVTGEIRNYRKRPQIEIKEPGQISVEEPKVVGSRQSPPASWSSGAAINE